MLAGALCSATLGGMLAQGSMASITSSAAEATAKITDIFEADKTNGGVITTKANNATTDDKTETLVFEYYLPLFSPFSITSPSREK